MKGAFFIKKLWQKDWDINKTVETFETKGDLILDQKLLTYDIFGSLAHAEGLKQIGILSQEELILIKKGLKRILELNVQGKFTLQQGEEDIHTKIENYLTEVCGEVGKKIHTGRSRNDQVLTAIRLFTKDEVFTIWENLLKLIAVLLVFSKKHKGIIMPGFTHMQKAMPSTVGMWSGAFIEGLLDDLVILKSVLALNNQSPLGSAAGYGIPLPIDRKYTANLLGFDHVQINSLYCQNSRGKIESAILATLIAILQDINKLATDVLLFTTSEFGFFEVAPELCSGSSIMPQKKNVDVAELLRSKVHILLGNYTQVVSMSSNLMSGYNRDLQDSKKPLFESLEIARDCLKIATILVKSIKINHKKIQQSVTPELFATHYALDLVKKGGNTFRDAYQKTVKKLTTISYSASKAIEDSKHLGGIGNLGLEILNNQYKNEEEKFNVEKKKFVQVQNSLWEGGGNHE